LKQENKTEKCYDCWIVVSYKMHSNYHGAWVSHPIYSLGCGVDDRSTIPGKNRKGIFFSLRYYAQSDAGAHPDSHSMGTAGS